MCFCSSSSKKKKNNKIKKLSQVKFKNATVDNFPVGVRR